ncbi:MAG: tRNA epoxyqueuosine(34) reductase QueG [Gemmatimonadota bacterium]|nr:tRNA epoxyqueuosine(34) reductase QueG [Gemmatimonadota bacterium]
MSRAALTERVRRAALDCGFDRVGFAPADPPAHADTYRAWLGRGHHGAMGYMAREDAVRRRLDPREALEGCRTIIVVTLVYGPGEVAGDAGMPGDPVPGRAMVARYARGRDYHDVFEERLDRLIDVLAAETPGASFRRYVDYGPVLERDHAQRAGLGWIGKNTMLIHPDDGSYVMLGELLTDLDLAPDDPFLPDRCGTCRRCLDACPTDAILPDRTIDARRCISYLTIELRGSIPVELRPAMGTRVFGCDICQEVCPWNADAPTPEIAPFAAPGTPVPPETLVEWAGELARLDDDGFRERYRGTAFRRPGRDGLLRNLAVGLGNTGSADARAMLERLVDDRSELVAEHARWGLARIEGTGPDER